MLAPIILFVYKKYRQTSLVVDALQKSPLCKKSDLYIFSDGFKDKSDYEDVQRVRDFVRGISGFRSVSLVLREKNMGLSVNYITGVDEVLKSYDSFIVVEDDVMTNPYFLKYMNDALVFYKDTKEVFSVSSYNLPPSLMSIPSYYTKDVYFNPRTTIWGFASWKDRWDNIDWEVLDYAEFMNDKASQKAFNRTGIDLTPMLKDKKEGRPPFLSSEIDALDIILSYNQFRNKGLCVCPIRSLSGNIGFGPDGTTTKKETTIFNNDLDFKQHDIKFPKKPFVDDALLKEFACFFNKRWWYHTIVHGTLHIIYKMIPKPIKSLLKKILFIK